MSIGGGGTVARSRLTVVVGTSAALILAGLLVAVLLVDGARLPIDRLLERRVPAGVPSPGHQVWATLTQLGSGSVLYPLLGLVAVLRWRARAGRSWWWALLPVLALAATQVLEGVLFVTLPRVRPAGVTPGAQSSFSSGHTAAAVLGWGLVCESLRGHVAAAQRSGRVVGRPISFVVAAALGMLVGSSRVVLGVHWPSDVLAALAIGLLSLLAVTAIDARATPADAESLLAESVREPLPRSTGWWWAVPAVAALLPVGLLLATPGPERLKDLLVYQGAGGVAGAGQDVYGFRTVFNMPFTYPPFAALLSEPLSRMPIGVGQALWTAMSLAALIPLARLALRPVVNRLGLPLTVTALLLASPVRSHLRFGQVGIFLTVAVAVDVLRSDRPRRGGALGLGLGVATAVKLTPAVFLPWLVLTRSWARLSRTLLWLVTVSTLGLLLLRRSATTVGVIGDSLTYQHGDGATRLTTRLARLGYTGIRVDGWPGRGMTRDQPTAPGSLSLVRGWRAAGFDPHTFVIALGTKNKDATTDFWTAQMAKLVDAVGPGHRIVWIGLGFRRAADERVAAFNTTAARFATGCGMQVAAWSAYVHSRDETGLWDPNGIVHMTRTGYRVRNDYVAATVGPAR